MAYMKKLFPQVKEFFFDDDTFTANLPRAREIAKKLAPLGPDLELQQPRQPRLRHHQVLQGLAACACSWSATRAATSRSSSNIKKGVTLDEMRRFTKACHEAGVVIHGTFILGLPVETQETIEETIRFAQELDVFSMQVSLAAPYPGTELYEMARQNGWFVKKDKTDLVEDDGFQQSALEYPGPEQGRDLRGGGPLLPRLLSAAQADPAHHQDHAGGQGRLRAPLPRRLRVLQEPPASARKTWPPPEVSPQPPRMREPELRKQRRGGCPSWYFSPDMTRIRIEATVERNQPFTLRMADSRSASARSRMRNFMPSGRPCGESCALLFASPKT